MYDTYSQRLIVSNNFFLSFSFKLQKFFLFICRIFNSRIIVNKLFLCLYKKEIEGTIYRKCENETAGKYSKYSYRYIGEKFSKNSWKNHHWYECNNSCWYSGDNRNTVFSESEHNRCSWFVSDTNFCGRCLDDNDNRIYRYTKGENEWKIRKKVKGISEFIKKYECYKKRKRKCNCGK